ncbi:MAG: hypothetical protein M5U12_21920 [Verrucomicrobia bacterium]|nr:hypothetical protein [Verrucomicrobiota bacterium]
MQDLVDIYCWGQYDDPTVGGGWRYSWNEHPDNSAAQWGAIGLTAAEKYWGSVIPTWVKDRNIVWVQYSKGGSGYGYTGPGDGEATTPSALVQLAFAGLSTTNALWQHGESYLARNWSSLVNNYNLYAHYAIAKALRTAHPQPVEKLTWQDKTWDWFLDPAVGLARFTVDQQRADGSWVSRDSWVNEPFLSTAYSIVLLSRAPSSNAAPSPSSSSAPTPPPSGSPSPSTPAPPTTSTPPTRSSITAGTSTPPTALTSSAPTPSAPSSPTVTPPSAPTSSPSRSATTCTPTLTDIASVEVRTTIRPSAHRRCRRPMRRRRRRRPAPRRLGVLRRR